MGSYDRDYMRGNQGGGSGYRDSYSNETHNVIWILIGINVVVFFAGWIVPNVFYESGRLPNGYLNLPKLMEGEVWRLFTYPFVHGSVIHLAFNMLMLYFFGKPLVNSQGLTNFLVIYGMGSMLGAAVQLIFHPASPVVGASASVIAVVAAYLWLRPQDIFQGMVMFVIPIRAKYKTLALVLLGFQVVMMLLDFANPSSGNQTAWPAHLGGYAYGWLHVCFLTGNAFKRQPKKARKPSRAKTVPYTRRPDNSKIIEAEFSDKKPDYDAILDKINREGIGSLTDEERKILEQASQSMNKGKDPN